MESKKNKLKKDIYKGILAGLILGTTTHAAYHSFSKQEENKMQEVSIEDSSAHVLFQDLKSGDFYTDNGTYVYRARVKMKDHEIPTTLAPVLKVFPNGVVLRNGKGYRTYYDENGNLVCEEVEPITYLNPVKESVKTVYSLEPTFADFREKHSDAKVIYAEMIPTKLLSEANDVSLLDVFERPYEVTIDSEEMQRKIETGTWEVPTKRKEISPTFVETFSQDLDEMKQICLDRKQELLLRYVIAHENASCYTDIMDLLNGGFDFTSDTVEEEKKLAYKRK